MQGYLGIAVGFPEKTADIRMAQYESGTRTPKEDLVKTLSGVLEVSPLAFSVPDIDSEQGLMHMLFALEDLYGLNVDTDNGEVRLHLENGKAASTSLSKMLSAWAEQAEKYKSGELTKEEYDQWRYNYPKYDVTQGWVKVPSQELSDALAEQFKDRLKDM
jgi:hypothetical protein